MNIGNNIKQLRQRLNLTQEQVALKLGVSYQAVSKWENNANTPDISLLPEIADLFGVSIDSLFTENIADCPDIRSFMRDDDVIRVVQIRGQKILKVSSTFSPGEPPIEIAFPHDCNDETQYFKVEVYGHVIADGAINGDVICHQSINSGTINGDVRSDGNIDVLFNELVLSDKLFEHCAEIDEAARNRMELIVPELAKQYGVTEQLKAENQMEWVRQMNACKAQAEAIVKFELIYD